MKSIYRVVLLGLVLLWGLPAQAQVCRDGECDIRWKMSDESIDLSTVCYNFRGTGDYRKCRKMDKQVFEKRCRTAQDLNKAEDVRLFCEEVIPRYVP